MGRPKRLARDTGHPSQARYEQIRRRLAAAVDSVCEVAGGSDGRGNPLKMTQVQLAERAGIPRATLCNYLSCRRAVKDVSGTPTLRDVVGIAHALNVPPAFLLLTEDDWIRLDQAIGTVFQAVEWSQLQHRLPNISKQLRKGGTFASDLAMEMAPVIKGEYTAVPDAQSSSKTESKHRLLTQGLINAAMVPRYARFEPNEQIEKSAPDFKGVLAFLFCLAMASSNETPLGIHSNQEQ
ncbi:helix-turn-helix transcriptional regulator [Paraburkholderia diazotrophica]|uniref:helix-turn-helix domain-containing protein n=1 Tax=Paraburkholderia diazotrophica TaxID=667676 RepID=UPI003176122D